MATVLTCPCCFYAIMGTIILEPKAIPEAIFEPISEPISEAIFEPISEPISKPISEPISEPISGPISGPILESFSSQWNLGNLDEYMDFSQGANFDFGMETIRPEQVEISRNLGE